MYPRTVLGWLAAPLVVFGVLLGSGCEGPAGPAGTSGNDGNDGENGNDGSTGAVGASCSITDNADGTRTIACEDGTTATVSDGADGLDGDAGTSCTVAPNADGTKTISCTDGTTVTVSDGDNGETGGNVQVANFHGSDALRLAEFEESGKYYANAAVTSATADAAGIVKVSFTVADPEGEPVLGLTGASFNIAKLVPAATGESFNKWVPYIYSTAVVSGSATGNWPNPDGTTAYQGSRENNGTLVDNGDGSYAYTFSNNISAVTVNGAAVSYERNRTHRISVMMGGSSGPTATATFDFVPDGSAVTERRDIVRTDACKSCHGQEFHGHGGDRLTVENCVTCHAPGSWDPQGGETVDFKVMIHKIHAGGALASIPGADGIVWDNPATAGDESADNGEYAIWGYRNTKHEWWKAEFPAVIENCTKCHQGAGANVDNWKAKPSREVCGSCHDDVNFATGANHGGGAQLTDNNCAVCHPAAGAISAPLSYPVPAAHEWMKKDPRHIPEFDVGLGVSAPANGQYFVDGEAPYVKIVLSKDGVPIDHTTVVEDNDGAEGCLTDPCPTGDGKFTVFSLFVHGPRARRVPVLTTLARAKVVSPTTGPWDLSATGAGLSLKVDSGKDVVVYDVSGGDKLASGTISVTVASGTVAGSCGTGVACIANATAVTAQEIVNWLNANAAFKARAIAYLDADRPAIRSRNLGVFYAVQLQTSAVATSVFANDLTVHPIGGSTVGNNLTQRTNPANNDPKVSRAVDALRYTLDPVDDLQPGTYVATVEIADGGRVSNTNYRTPSVAKVTFQVGTATAEAAPAGNCDQCHQGPEGTGFILDFMRHYKIFDDTAVDQCGSCHDYQSSVATGNWGGARPISKRVHAVHFGSSLVYPLLTVDYSNGDPIAGRNWDITFPQDVRNCETCHSSSSTWMTKPARLPCAGCHDSDAAKGHMTVMTADPTPADPWSGDETESCQACH